MNLRRESNRFTASDWLGFLVACVILYLLVWYGF